MTKIPHIFKNYTVNVLCQAELTQTTHNKIGSSLEILMGIFLKCSSKIKLLKIEIKIKLEKCLKNKDSLTLSSKYFMVLAIEQDNFWHRFY
jgi:hypothetical protein